MSRQTSFDPFGVIVYALLPYAWHLFFRVHIVYIESSSSKGNGEARKKKVMPRRNQTVNTTTSTSIPPPPPDPSLVSGCIRERCQGERRSPDAVAGCAARNCRVEISSAGEQLRKALGWAKRTLQSKAFSFSPESAEVRRAAHLEGKTSRALGTLKGFETGKEGEGAATEAVKQLQGCLFEFLTHVLPLISPLPSAASPSARAHPRR